VKSLRANNLLLLSASDLTNHLGCRHLTELNRSVAHGDLERPRYVDHALKLLQERGDRFEKDYIAHLESTGADVIQLQVPADLPLFDTPTPDSLPDHEHVRGFLPVTNKLPCSRVTKGSAGVLRTSRTLLGRYPTPRVDTSTTHTWTGSQ
jgi:hypothetical protein